jgi:UPF0755 protein
LDLRNRAETAYGPPTKDLSLYQQAYLSALLLMQKEDLKNPTDPQGLTYPFHIEIGESTQVITENLQTQGLISNADALRSFLVYSGMDRTLQAGDYELSPSLTAIEIAIALQDATPDEIVFQILPGWRLEEIASAIPTSGLEFSPELFLLAVNNPPNVSPLIIELPPDASLEGFLYPDSYQLFRDISVEDFISKIMQDFEIKVDQSIRSGFQNQGLTLHQAVTLASIVEREAVVEDEMPIIASVFLNRLAVGMKLETDPTVQYALGYIPSQKTWWKNPLSLNDLQVESPYNTYLYNGLPPGPISNPSLNALRAVAFPAETPYYYFRAACDNSGKHSFSITFEEHKQKECPPDE